MNATGLKTGHPVVDRAFRIALGDFFGNIQPWQGELDERPRPCILAGLEYNKPWTRDGPSTAGLPSASWYLT